MSKTNDSSRALRRLGLRVEKYSRFEKLFERRLGPRLAARSRVLRELGKGSPKRCGTDLAIRLHMDRGNVSRILARLGARGLVQKHPSPVDRRLRYFCLTEKGRRVLERLERGRRGAILRTLHSLPEKQQRRLIAGMSAIAGVLTRGGFTNARERLQEAR